MYISWRRELAIRESQTIESLRGTAEWSQAMTDLCFQAADLEDAHNVRMVAARAQQLVEEASGHRN